MKISKLFHWLYATLMLLPIAFVLSRCFYVIFNENASATFDLMNTFTESLNNLNTNALFSWAQSSFLIAPFTYIGDLFGLPNSSPILTLMSYWLDVSIIWLVFDVIMYLPLLIHRWLDKGVIE